MKSGADADAYVQRQTADTPLGRIGEPEDIASMVAFLSSKEAGFITAQHFIVDGGRCRAL
jgi:NAD(P)-dependent dehydrogenase (short-subunit alcohol dehydrogenase family)